MAGRFTCSFTIHTVSKRIRREDRDPGRAPRGSTPTRTRSSFSDSQHSTVTTGRPLATTPISCGTGVRQCGRWTRRTNAGLERRRSLSRSRSVSSAFPPSEAATDQNGSTAERRSETPANGAELEIDPRSRMSVARSHEIVNFKRVYR